jgi:hypothetical protein
MTVVYIINTVIHNNVKWEVVRIGESYYARCDGSDTGPYATYQEAEEFITAIKISS